MTWTDDPITKDIRRKKIHITELLEAVYERTCALCWNTLDPSNNDEHPFWYLYDSKAWGDDYPKADKTHHPPNEDPDNEFRNNHIEILRYNLINGTALWVGNGDFESLAIMNIDCENILERYIKADDEYYRPYEKNPLTAYDYTEFNIWKDAFGDDYISDAFTDSTIYTSGDEAPTKARAIHINELRRLVEALNTIWVSPTNSSITIYRRRSSVPPTYSTGATIDDAWSAAKTALAAASWAEVSGTDAITPCGVASLLRDSWDYTTSTHTYSAHIAEFKVVMNFNFDFDIQDNTKLGWSIFPPLKFDLYGSGYKSYELRYINNVLNNNYDTDSVGFNITSDDISGTSSIIQELPNEHYNLDEFSHTYLTEHAVGTRAYYIGTIPEGALNDDTYEITLNVNNVDYCKPTTPTAEENPSADKSAQNIRRCGLMKGNLSPDNVRSGMAYAVIQPDWKYGNIET